MAILNPTEILIAQELINKKPRGIYELKEIYGSIWSSVGPPTTFGTRFKETVETGRLKLIELKPKKTDNHQTYEILK